MRVLVVDDEPDVRLIARLVLEAGGFEVDEAADGNAALAALRERPTPDVLVLDIRMPEVDGWTVLQTMRDDDASAHVPVVVFTADAGAAIEMPEGVMPDELVMKPFQPDALLERVKRVAARLTS